MQRSRRRDAPSEQGAVVQRFGSVTRLKGDAREEYLRLHSDVWPEVRDLIRRHGIVNHSIFLKGDLLFRYYEYVGSDHARDMQLMGADPVTKRWLALTDPCQESLVGPSNGPWSDMTEICYLE